jgi:hypothetical protein
VTAEEEYDPKDFLPDDVVKAIESGKEPKKKKDLASMMKIVQEEAASIPDDVKAERMERYYANMTRDHGENATAIQRCMFSDESKLGNVQEFWIDNVWQKAGVRYLSV